MPQRRYFWDHKIGVNQAFKQQNSIFALIKDDQNDQT